jgi:hypothetical protein
MSDETEEIVELRHGPTLDDIREWGRQQGEEVPERGRLPKGLRARFNEAHGLDTPRVVHAVPPEDIERVEETAPAVPVDKSPIQKVKSVFGRGKSPVSRSAVRKSRKPRVSTENVVSFLWGGFASVVKPFSVPASRAFAMEAPIAGMVLDETIKGTFTDRILQPLARAEAQGKVWGALLAPPLIVAAIDKRPDKAEYLLPMLRQSLAWHIEVAGPKMEEKMKREQEFEAKYGASVDQMIAMIFGVEPETSDE